MIHTDVVAHNADVSISELNPTNLCMVKQLLRLLLPNTASVAPCKAVSVCCFSSVLEVSFQDYHSVLHICNT